MTTAIEVEVKERPILFSGPMVRAILEGRKTQTRRVVTFLPEYPAAQYVRVKSDARISKYDPVLSITHPDAYAACPYGKAGDCLWVRETWATHFNDRFHEEHGLSAPDCLTDGKSNEPTAVYAADHQFPMLINEEFMVEHNHVAWKPSSHMRRSASRITLEITNVRAERLQEISEEDAIAEGVDSVTLADVPRQATTSHRADFKQLWDKINGKRKGCKWSRNRLFGSSNSASCEFLLEGKKRSMEETFTDREFCRMWKIDRATSLRWRDEGIVGYVKLPNGSIRYLQSHIDELKGRFAKSAGLQNSKGAVKGGVVDIGVAKRRNDGSVAQNA